LNLIRWFVTPQSSPKIDKRNFVNVQIDAIGVGLAGAAAPFLPVFLTRLNASNLQVSLLTTMPAITGFVLAIFLGRMLQKQKNIIPWFSAARLAVIMSYAVTGLITFFIPPEHLVVTTLVVWALATIPQVILNICFSVVMNAVAGPVGRFELMSRRWSILGFTTAITVFLIGQILDRLPFPINYQVAFITLSFGGLISFYFSSHISLPDVLPPEMDHSHSLKAKVIEFFSTIFQEQTFTSFIAKRWVYMVGFTMTVPLLPLYFVREIHATDSWIATISTSKTAVMIIGYYLWTQRSRKSGSRSVLLWTTAGVSLYPILTAITSDTWPIVIYAGLAGLFQAGLDLVFFDELMKTVPEALSATFVSFAQSMQHLASIIAPLVGSFLADRIGIGPALIISGCIQIIGFALFLTSKMNSTTVQTVSG
jgi:hypothetical protein